MRCSTCEDTGIVHELDEEMIPDPSALHGYRAKAVRVDSDCPDCERCAECGKRLALAAANDLIPLRTYDGAPLRLEFCDFHCLDRHVESQSRETRLIILGMILHWWSIHRHHDTLPDLTLSLIARFNCQSAELLKELCE